jgi:hypothetical protein
MGSGAMMYMPSFIETGSGIQKLMGGHTDRDRMPTFMFFKIQKVGYISHIDMLYNLSFSPNIVSTIKSEAKT